MKKILSIILALCLIFALSVPAFAATAENVQQYSVYTSFGDSIGACQSWVGYYPLSFDEKEGTFPYLLREALGAKHNCYSIGCMSTRELRYMFDPTYSDDYMFSLMRGDCTAEMVDEMRPDIIQSVIDSDIISFNFGANDILSFALSKVEAYSAALPKLETGIEDIDSAAESVSSVVSLPATVIAALEENFAVYYTDYYESLKTVRSLNEDARILLIGVYNPLEGLPLSDDSALALGDIFTLITERINTYVKALACQFNCTYVDINGTPSVFMENNYPLLSDDFFSKFYDIHPSRAGQVYILNKILQVLPERKEITLELNIGSLTKVDTVYLDGVAYPCTVKNGIATVQCEGKSFDTAAVYGWEKSKFTSVYTQKVWSLSFDGEAFVPTYLVPYKNIYTYSKVNALVAANYGCSVINGK